MPRGDGTGPIGSGSMTGRGAGYCAGYARPGYMNLIPGRGGFGNSRGGGSGWRNQFYATGLPGWARAGYRMPVYGGGYPYAENITPQAEANILKEEAENLKQQLTDVQNRINMLEKVQE